MSTNKLKHLLAENMLRFNTKNLHESDYQSLGQKGELPMLDPAADQAHQDSVMRQIEQAYSRIKPKRVDMTEFKNDVRDLLSIYKDKTDVGGQNFIQAFFELYPFSKTNTAWRGTVTDLNRLISHLLRHAKTIDQGDTSSWGYRVHP
jgi:hypothetical protein